MILQQLLGSGSDLFIVRRMCFTPVRTWGIVIDSKGRKLISAQTYFENWRSKRRNTRRFHKKYGFGEGKCVIVDCECKEIW